MRLVATEYLSLDGVFEEPGRWSFPYFDESAAQFKWKELQESEALLLGRRTYQGFAAAWPEMEGTGEFGERMNTITKYVVSSTLDAVDWTGSRLVRGDVAAEVRRLKEQPGKDLLLSGSGRLFNTLVQENLVDVYRFMVHPVVLGSGRRLFAEGAARPMQLMETESFGSGIVVLEYVPAAGLAGG